MSNDLTVSSTELASAMLDPSFSPAPIAIAIGWPGQQTMFISNPASGTITITSDEEVNLVLDADDLDAITHLLLTNQ